MTQGARFRQLSITPAVVLMLATPAAGQVSRSYATGPVTLYVDPASGSDANSCTLSAPCQHVTHAAKVLCGTIDLNTQKSSIQLLPLNGVSFVENVQLCPYVGSPSFPGSTIPPEDNPVILGDENHPENFTINGTDSPAVIGVGVYTPWTIAGLTVRNTVSTTSAIEADFGTVLYLHHVNIGPTGTDLLAIWGSKIEITGPLHITFPPYTFAVPMHGGGILVREPPTGAPGPVVFFDSGVVPYNRIVYSSDQGLFWCYGPTFSGGDGVPFASLATNGAGINTNGTCQFPGGLTATNGGWVN